MSEKERKRGRWNEGKNERKRDRMGKWKEGRKKRISQLSECDIGRWPLRLKAV